MVATKRIKLHNIAYLVKFYLKTTMQTFYFVVIYLFIYIFTL